MGELILIRHGETQWSAAGRHTGRTDVPLTDHGEAAAAALAPALAKRDTRAAFTSPAGRALRTAELAGLGDATRDPDLQEWDYGGYEGLTTAQIRSQRPGWYLWRDGVIPGEGNHPGETVEQGGKRLDPDGGRLFRLDTGTVSTLGEEHDQPVILSLNLPPAAAGARAPLAQGRSLP